jgi:hypothetical protein
MTNLISIKVILKLTNMTVDVVLKFIQILSKILIPHPLLTNLLDLVKVQNQSTCPHSLVS